MATLKKSVLGKVSGAVGDILFRIKNGKNFIGTRPLSFIPGMDDKSINRRKHFRITGKLASSINKMSPMKKLWDIYTPNTMLPFNGIFKANYAFTNSEDITNLITLSPDMGFEVPTPSYTISSSQIVVDIPAIGAGTAIDTAVETQFILTGIIYCNGKTDDTFKDYIFLSTLYPKSPLSLTAALSFTYDMNDVEKQLYERYSTHKLFFCLVSLTALSEPLHFSETFNTTS